MSDYKVMHGGVVRMNDKDCGFTGMTNRAIVMMLNNLEAENAELKKVISGADSLLDGIFERIPYSFMTGHGWDKEWEEIKNCGVTNNEAEK